MASGNNEAKIKFSADTKDFEAAIKSSKNAVKDASAEMKLAAAEYRNTGNAVDFYQKKSEALNQKLQANAQQQEALNGMIQVATEIYGEDSDQVNNLERQLTYAMAAEQNLQAEITNCNQALEEQASGTDSSVSALDDLTGTIEEQQAELDSLKEEYVNAYLEFGETSDEAQNLASRISELSGSLAENQSEVDAAKSAADGLDQSMQGVGEESESSGSIFSAAVDKMSGAISIAAIPAAVTGIITTLKDLGERVMEEAETWENSFDTMANSTGAVGYALDGLMEDAANAYASTRDMNTSLEEMSAACGQINTLFGYSGEELENLGVKITEFSGVVGEDSVSAVTDLYRITQLWGDEAGTDSEVLDKLTYAAQQSGASMTSINSVLTDCQGAMEGLGMSFDDGLSFLIEYCQAGGDAADVSRILQTAYSNLNGEVDNVPEVWNRACYLVGKFDDVNKAMNSTIGVTGLRISDVFGEGKSGQKIVSTFLNGKVAAEDFSEGVENCSGQLERTMLANTDFTDQAKIGWKELAADATEAAADATNSFFSWDNAIKLLGSEYEVMIGQSTRAMENSSAFTDSVANAFSYLMEETQQSMSGCAYALSTGEYSAQQLADATGVSVDEINAAMQVYESAMENGGQAASDSKDKASDAMSGIDKSTSSASKSASGSIKGFESAVKTSTANAAESAGNNMDALSRKLSSLAGKTWSTGTVSIPHFTLTGAFDLKSGSVPVVAVSYYAKGGIMTEPTLFGINNGTAMIGGEAGAEAILPIDTLLDTVYDAISDGKNNIDYDKLASAIASQPITMELNGRDIARASR